MAVELIMSWATGLLMDDALVDSVCLFCFLPWCLLSAFGDFDKVAIFALIIIDASLVEDGCECDYECDCERGVENSKKVQMFDFQGKKQLGLNRLYDWLISMWLLPIYWIAKVLIDLNGVD